MIITKKLILECLDLSVFSYQNPARDWAIDMSKYENIFWIINNNASCFFATKNNNLYLAITGSNDLTDWRMNFDFGLVNWDNFRYPNGFIEYYKLLRDDILYYIANEEYNKLIITGHSLGSVSSIIASNDIRKHIESKKEIINIGFGTPKAFGNLQTKRFYQRNVKGIHIINSCDIVTKVPLFMENNFRRFKVGRCNFWSKIFGSTKAHYPAEYKKNIIANKKLNKKLRKI